MPDAAPDWGTVPDDLPKRHLFREPIRVADVHVPPAEQQDDGRWRVTFRVEVRDAGGAPCPDLAVEARITGPERVGAGMAHTDMFGRVRFRSSGPPGRYVLEVLDVAAGALELERADGDVVARAEADVPTRT